MLYRPSSINEADQSNCWNNQTTHESGLFGCNLASYTVKAISRVLSNSLRSQTRSVNTPLLMAISRLTGLHQQGEKWGGGGGGGSGSGGVERHAARPARPSSLPASSSSASRACCVCVCARGVCCVVLCCEERALGAGCSSLSWRRRQSKKKKNLGVLTTGDVLRGWGRCKLVCTAAEGGLGHMPRGDRTVLERTGRRREVGGTVVLVWDGHASCKKQRGFVVCYKQGQCSDGDVFKFLAYC